MDREVGTEDLNCIALLAVYVSDVNHAYVHADVAYVIGFSTIDQTVATAVAQVTVKAISISYWYGGYA